MPNIVESSEYDAGVYRLERTDPADAGANQDGPLGLAAVNLANRTAFLKAAMDIVITGEGGVPDNVDPALFYSAIQAAVAAGSSALPAVMTQAEAEAGVSVTPRLLTAERIAQAIAALVSLRAPSKS